jgi:Fur family transcriptional regulator, peroxide stress response regulator
MSAAEIIEKLKQNKLRVTPQRIAIYEAIYKLNNHPTAENIINYLKKKHPYISQGTVYKVLDSLVESNLLKKVKTENGVMRYDPVLSAHHHLYCLETDRIEDYEDDELDQIIYQHFKKKKINNFQITDIKLQISGNFKTK